jgi:hypothetical protein
MFGKIFPANWTPFGKLQQIVMSCQILKNIPLYLLPEKAKKGPVANEWNDRWSCLAVVLTSIQMVMGVSIRS